MKTLKIITIAFLLLSALIHPDSRACTTFQLNHDGQIYVGKNYDWMVGDGLLIVNKRGAVKTAMRSIGDNTGLGQPATWTSRYGSITFNQYGRELSVGGMNEVGLVIESMGLFRNTPNRKYPEPDDRVSILMQQWKQYQLDNFASVKEIIASDTNLRIRPKKGVHIHYLVSDREGNCAAIEFLNGKMVCHLNNNMPVKVLTNNTYAESLEYFEQDKVPEPDMYRSIDRFIRAAKRVNSDKLGSSAALLDDAFDILKSVSWSVNRTFKDISYTSNTRWSIVYDPNNLRIHFRTWDNQQIRVVNLRTFDFSCATPVKIFDINTRLSGNVTNKFADYTQQKNRDLIEKAFTKTVYLPKFQAEKLDILSKYPETIICDK